VFDEVEDLEGRFDTKELLREELQVKELILEVTYKV
jgi:hypothetical protein